MWGRGCGRQRERNEGSGEREQQQESGGQAMHAISVDQQNPQVGQA